MFEQGLAYILRKFLGEYIEDGSLLGERVQLGIWSGFIVLEQLVLKKSVFDIIDAPVTLTHGVIGRLEIRIPWGNLSSEPMVVIIDRVYLLLEPKYEWDSDRQENREQAIKMAKLAAAELFSSQRNSASDPLQKYRDLALKWLMESVLNKIIENLQVTIRDIHIRFEDHLSCPSNFCVGFTLDSLLIQSREDAKSDEKVSYLLHDPINNQFEGPDTINKIIQFNNFSLYWNPIYKKSRDTCFTSFLNMSNSEIENNLSRTIPRRNQHSIDRPLHHYILTPMDTDVYIAIKFVDEILIFTSIFIPKISVIFEDKQYREIISLSTNMANFIQLEKFSKFRPKFLVSEDKRAWWRYAINSVIYQLQSNQRLNLTWKRLKKRIDDKYVYVELWKRKIIGKVVTKPFTTKNLEISKSFLLDFRESEVYKQLLEISRLRRSKTMLKKDIMLRNILTNSNSIGEVAVSPLKPLNKDTSALLNLLEYKLSYDDIIYFRSLAEYDLSYEIPNGNFTWLGNILSWTTGGRFDSPEAGIKGTEQGRFKVYESLHHKDRPFTPKSKTNQSITTVTLSILQGSIILALSTPNNNDSFNGLLFPYSINALPFLELEILGLQLDTNIMSDDPNHVKLSIILHDIETYEVKISLSSDFDLSNQFQYDRLISRHISPNTASERHLKLSQRYPFHLNNATGGSIDPYRIQEINLAMKRLSPIFSCNIDLTPNQHDREVSASILLEELEILLSPSAQWVDSITVFSTWPKDLGYWSEMEMSAINQMADLKSRLDSKLEYMMNNHKNVYIEAKIKAPKLLLCAVKDIYLKENDLCELLVIDLGLITLRTEVLAKATHHAKLLSGSKISSSRDYTSDGNSVLNDLDADRLINENNFLRSSDLWDKKVDSRSLNTITDDIGNEVLYDSFIVNISNVEVYMLKLLDWTIQSQNQKNNKVVLVEEFDIIMEIQSSVLPWDTSLPPIKLYMNIPNLTVNLSTNKVLKFVPFLLNLKNNSENFLNSLREKSKVIKNALNSRDIEPASSSLIMQSPVKSKANFTANRSRAYSENFYKNSFVDNDDKCEYYDASNDFPGNKSEIYSITPSIDLSKDVLTNQNSKLYNNDNDEVNSISSYLSIRETNNEVKLQNQLSEIQKLIKIKENIIHTRLSQIRLTESDTNKDSIQKRLLIDLKQNQNELQQLKIQYVELLISIEEIENKYSGNIYENYSVRANVEDIFSSSPNQENDNNIGDKRMILQSSLFKSKPKSNNMTHNKSLLFMKVSINDITLKFLFDQTIDKMLLINVNSIQMKLNHRLLDSKLSFTVRKVDIRENILSTDYFSYLISTSSHSSNSLSNDAIEKDFIKLRYDVCYDSEFSKHVIKLNIELFQMNFDANIIVILVSMFLDISNNIDLNLFNSSINIDDSVERDSINIKANSNCVKHLTDVSLSIKLTGFQINLLNFHLPYITLALRSIHFNLKLSQETVFISTKIVDFDISDQSDLILSNSIDHFNPIISITLSRDSLNQITINSKISHINIKLNSNQFEELISYVNNVNMDISTLPKFTAQSNNYSNDEFKISAYLDRILSICCGDFDFDFDGITLDLTCSNMIVNSSYSISLISSVGSVKVSAIWGILCCENGGCEFISSINDIHISLLKYQNKYVLLDNFDVFINIITNRRLSNLNVNDNTVINKPTKLKYNSISSYQTAPISNINENECRLDISISPIYIKFNEHISNFMGQFMKFFSTLKFENSNNLNISENNDIFPSCLHIDINLSLNIKLHTVIVYLDAVNNVQDSKLLKFLIDNITFYSRYDYKLIEIGECITFSFNVSKILCDYYDCYNNFNNFSLLNHEECNQFLSIKASIYNNYQLKILSEIEEFTISIIPNSLLQVMLYMNLLYNQLVFGYHNLDLNENDNLIYLLNKQSSKNNAKDNNQSNSLLIDFDNVVPRPISVPISFVHNDQLSNNDNQDNMISNNIFINNSSLHLPKPFNSIEFNLIVNKCKFQLTNHLNLLDWLFFSFDSIADIKLTSESDIITSNININNISLGLTNWKVEFCNYVIKPFNININYLLNIQLLQVVSITISDIYVYITVDFTTYYTFYEHVIKMFIEPFNLIVSKGNFNTLPLKKSINRISTNGQKINNLIEILPHLFAITTTSVNINLSRITVHLCNESIFHIKHFFKFNFRDIFVSANLSSLLNHSHDILNQTFSCKLSHDIEILNMRLNTLESLIEPFDINSYVHSIKANTSSTFYQYIDNQLDIKHTMLTENSSNSAINAKLEFKLDVFKLVNINITLNLLQSLCLLENALKRFQNNLQIGFDSLVTTKLDYVLDQSSSNSESNLSNSFIFNETGNEVDMQYVYKSNDELSSNIVKETILSLGFKGISTFYDSMHLKYLTFRIKFSFKNQIYSTLPYEIALTDNLSSKIIFIESNILLKINECNDSKNLLNEHSNSNRASLHIPIYICFENDNKYNLILKSILTMNNHTKFNININVNMSSIILWSHYLILNSTVVVPSFLTGNLFYSNINISISIEDTIVSFAMPKSSINDIKDLYDSTDYIHGDFKRMNLHIYNSNIWNYQSYKVNDELMKCTYNYWLYLDETTNLIVSNTIHNMNDNVNNNMNEIKYLPTICISNLLANDINIIIENEYVNQNLEILSGECLDSYLLHPLEEFFLKLQFKNMTRWSQSVIIRRCGTECEDLSTLTDVLYDNDSILSIIVEVKVNNGKREILIYVPYWIVTSSIHDVFYQHDLKSSSHTDKYINGKIDNLAPDQWTNKKFNYRKTRKSNKKKIAKLFNDDFSSNGFVDLLKFSNDNTKNGKLAINMLSNKNNVFSSPMSPIKNKSIEHNMNINLNRFKLMHCGYTFNERKVARLRLSSNNTYWSQGFSLDKVGSFGIDVRCKQSNNVHSYGINISLNKYPFQYTKTIVILDRYILINQMNQSLQIRQYNCSDVTTLTSYEDKPFIWKYGKELLLQCKINRYGWNWSGRFKLSLKDAIDIPIRLLNSHDNTVYFILISIVIEGPKVFIVFKGGEMVAPYRIENHTVNIYRIKQCDQSIVTTLLPYHSFLYAWDEPLLSHKLKIEYQFNDQWIILGYYTFDELKVITSDNKLIINVSADGPIRVLDIYDKRTAAKIHLPGNLRNFKTRPTIFESKINVRGIGISIIDHIPQELVYLSINDINISYTYHIGYYDDINISIFKLQIDNQLLSTSYPAIFYPLPVVTNISNHSIAFPNDYLHRNGKLSNHLSKELDTKNFISLHVRRDYKYKGILYLPNFEFSIEPFDISVDGTIISRLLNLFLEYNKIINSYNKLNEMKSKISANSFLSINNQNKMNDGFESYGYQHINTILSRFKQFPIQSLNTFSLRLYVEYFNISTVKFNFSFNPAVNRNESLTTLYDSIPNYISESIVVTTLKSILLTIASCLAKIDNCNIKLNSLNYKNLYINSNNLTNQLVNFYINQCIWQSIVIVGSSEATGNVVEVIMNLYEGIKDFFYLPIEGLHNSPYAFVVGMLLGTSSLLKRTISSCFTMCGHMAVSLQTGLLTALPIELNIIKVNKKVQRIPNNLYDGLHLGLTGLAMDPIVSYLQHGIKGIPNGIFKGLLGVVFRPLYGFLGSISNTMDQISYRLVPRLLRHEKSFISRSRPPRFFENSFMPLKTYSADENTGRELLSRVDGGKYLSEGYVSYYECSYDDEVSENNDVNFVLILTSQSLLLVSIKPYLKTIWQSNYNQMNSLDINIIDNKPQLQIYYYPNDKLSNHKNRNSFQWLFNKSYRLHSNPVLYQLGFHIKHQFILLNDHSSCLKLLLYLTDKHSKLRSDNVISYVNKYITMLN